MERSFLVNEQVTAGVLVIEAARNEDPSFKSSDIDEAVKVLEDAGHEVSERNAGEDK